MPQKIIGFPVGSSQGVVRFRPVSIKPGNSVNQSFKVRMANMDATIEGFDRQIREETMCRVNPKFYHRIYASIPLTEADVTIFYDELLDGSFNDFAHWQQIPQWQSTGPTVFHAGNSPSFSSVTVEQWNRFIEPPFALANSSVNFDLIPPALICQGDSTTIMAPEGYLWYEFQVNGQMEQAGIQNVFITNTLQDGDSIWVMASDSNCTVYGNTLAIMVIPQPQIIAEVDTVVVPGATVQLGATGGTDYSWTPVDGLDCTNCDNPIANPQVTTTYVVSAFDELGCFGRDSVLIIVDELVDPETVLLVPNAITPNGDGINEFWNIRNLDLYPENEVVIVNRWGDEVFSSKPYMNDWGGTYNQKNLPSGTYYFVLKLHPDLKPLNGPLTILR
ncbi:MAG TPA: gliding motility-associated C-terminal domain-containing protein [Chromatiaceae bacterium]|nr:gliding motility-associated C-terminal domain-containing protein [Chromatiaceae bacterium]